MRRGTVLHVCIGSALALAACKEVEDERHDMPVADPARGLAVIAAAGCGSCHEIPGLAWPEGKIGPSLDGFAERTMIGGKLPNQPAVLVPWLRNAPALIPGTTMPAMPISEGEARDAAAYLYTLKGV